MCSASGCTTTVKYCIHVSVSACCVFKKYTTRPFNVGEMTSLHRRCVPSDGKITGVKGTS